MKEVFDSNFFCDQTENKTETGDGCQCPQEDYLTLATIQEIGGDRVRITNGLGDVLDIPESHWEEAVNLLESRYNEMLDLQDEVAEEMAKTILAEEFAGQKFAPAYGFLKCGGVRADYAYVNFPGTIVFRSFEDGPVSADCSCLDALHAIVTGFWKRKSIQFRSIREPYLVDFES